MRILVSSALAVLLALPSVCLAQPASAEPAPEPAAAAKAEAEPADVLATYERGKAAYDRGDFDAALLEFDRAAQADPTRARWQYNRGLALKKLGRTDEAVAALRKSRELDPNYKVAEIDKKLADMGASGGTATSTPGLGPSPGAEGSSDDSSLPYIVLMVFAAVFVVFGAFAIQTIRTGIRESKSLKPELLQQRLLALGERLIPLEHRFSRGEDAQARKELEWAADQEREARKLLPKASLKVKKARAMAACLDLAEKAAAACEKRLDEAFGPDSHAIGERVGCWFCARALPNPEVRVPVTMQLSGKSATAVACRDCADLALTGRPPRVTMVGQPGGTLRHWSDVSSFDPYRHRHQPQAGAQAVGLHKATGGLDLGTLGSAVAGAAVAAGAVAAAASLLDLAALGQTAAAAAAAKASAAGADRSKWADQS